MGAGTDGMNRETGLKQGFTVHAVHVLTRISEKWLSVQCVTPLLPLLPFFSQILWKYASETVY